MAGNKLGHHYDWENAIHEALPEYTLIVDSTTTVKGTKKQLLNYMINNLKWV